MREIKVDPKGETMRKLQNRAYTITKGRGFDLSSNVVQLLLIGTEIQEAIECFDVNVPNLLRPILIKFSASMNNLEELRKTIKLSDASKLKVNNNLPEELADIVIRVMTYAGSRGIDLQDEIEKKLRVNETRPHLHGKKF